MRSKLNDGYYGQFYYVAATVVVAVVATLAVAVAVAVAALAAVLLQKWLTWAITTSFCYNFSVTATVHRPVCCCKSQ